MIWKINSTLCIMCHQIRQERNVHSLLRSDSKMKMKYKVVVFETSFKSQVTWCKI